MLEAGNTKLVVGRVRLTSEITLDAATLSLCGLYFGDHNVTCGVRIARPLEEYQRAVQEAAEAFERADIPAIIRLLDRDFEGGTYSLKSLFKDEQRRILSIILESTLSEAEENFRRLYEQHASLMRFLADIGTPLPKAFRAVAEFALNSELRQAFLTKDLNPERIVRLFEEARSVKVEFDAPTLEYALRRRVEEVAESFAAQPDDLSSLEKLETTVSLACTAPFEVGLWKAQNICFELIQDVYPRMRSKIEQGDESAKAWVERFHAVAEKLSLRVNSGG